MVKDNQVLLASPLKVVNAEGLPRFSSSYYHLTFLEAYFMNAEHEDISWVISLVMPGQKIDCLA